MPCHVFPELAADLPPEPARRMQGKPCFNVSAVSGIPVPGLERLIRAGFGRYREAGFMET